MGIRVGKQDWECFVFVLLWLDGGAVGASRKGCSRELVLGLVELFVFV